MSSISQIGAGRKPITDSVKLARQLNAILNGKGHLKPRGVGPKECVKSANCKSMHGKAAPVCDTRTHKCRPRKTTRGGDGEAVVASVDAMSGGGRKPITDSVKLARQLNAILNGKGHLKPRGVGPKECVKSVNCKSMHGKAAPVCDTRTHKCRPRKTKKTTVGGACATC